MSEEPIATFHQSYVYFELYQEYIQIHQSKTGVIPYPAIIKNNGEKFYFKDIKSLKFFKKLTENNNVKKRSFKLENADIEYSCKIMTKHKSLKISSLLNWEGRRFQNSVEEYSHFIQAFLELVKPYKPRLYKGSDFRMIVNKELSFNLLVKKTINPMRIVTFILTFFLFMLKTDFFSEDFTHSSYAFLIFIVIALEFTFRFIKSKTNWEVIETNYLP